MKLENLSKAKEELEKDKDKEKKGSEKLKRSGDMALELGNLDDKGKGGESKDHSLNLGERKEETPAPSVELEILRTAPSPGKGALLREVDKKLYNLFRELDQDVPYTASLSIDQERRERLNGWCQTLGLTQKVLLSVLIDYVSDKFDNRIEEIRTAKKQRN